VYIKQLSEQTDTISSMHMYVSAVNMSKSCCFALLLAVICPSTQVQADHCDVKQALSSQHLSVSISLTWFY